MNKWARSYQTVLNSEAMWRHILQSSNDESTWRIFKHAEIHVQIEEIYYT